MLCPKCQNTLPDGVKFCARCGTQIPAAPQMPQQGGVRPAQYAQPVRPAQQQYSAQQRPLQPQYPAQPQYAAPVPPVYPAGTMPAAEEPKRSNAALIGILVSVVVVLVGVALFLLFRNHGDDGSSMAASGVPSPQAGPAETLPAAPEVTYAPETLPAPETEPPTTLDVTFWYAETERYIDFEIPISGYIIEDSDTRRISESELYWMTEHQVCIARNEIYARHGNIFSGQVYSDYFNHMPWYTEITKNVTLTQIEKDNVSTITAYEKSMGW